MGIFDKVKIPKVKEALRKSFTPKKIESAQLRPAEIMARRLLEKWNIISEEHITLSLLLDDAETPYLCQITKVEPYKPVFGGKADVRVECQYYLEDAYATTYYNSMYGDEEDHDNYDEYQWNTPQFKSSVYRPEHVLKVYVDPEFYEKLMIILTT